jgi:hypothetical protein
MLTGFATGCSGDDTAAPPDGAADGTGLLPPGDDGPAPAQGQDAQPGVDSTVGDASPGEDSTVGDAPASDGLAQDGPATDAPEDGGPGTVVDAPAEADALETAADSGDATVPDGSGGSVTDAASDGSVLDAANEAGEAGDGGYAGPTLVQSGENLKMRGMTADDNVVYISRVTNTYFAQSIAPGSSPTQLYTLSSTQSGMVSVLGDLVFVWGYAHFYASTITLWSSALATPVNVTNTAYAGYVWASADSKHFAYVNVTNTTAPYVGSIIGVDLDSSGMHPTTLVTNVDLSHCSVAMRFSGSYVVAGYCAATDAAVTQTVQSFSIPDGWSPGLVVPGSIDGFVVDPNGQLVVAASTASAGGDLQAFPIDGGGTPTVLDPSTHIVGAKAIVGSPTYPWSIDYAVGGGGLMQTYVDNPAPQVLVDAGITRVDAVSGDGKWLLVTNQLDSNGHDLDLSLASTLVPGTPQLVATSTQYGSMPLGLAASKGVFTTDGQSLLFYTSYAPSAGIYVGSLQAMSITAPSTYRQLSTGLVYDDVSLAGSKVLMLDDFEEPDGSTIPLVDLKVIDVSTSDPAQLIASAVPREVAVSADLSKFAYVVLLGPTAGVYVANVP